MQMYSRILKQRSDRGNLESVGFAFTSTPPGWLAQQKSDTVFFFFAGSMDRGTVKRKKLSNPLEAQRKRPQCVFFQDERPNL